MNLEEAKEEFLKYAEPYKDLNRLCLLKIHHTFRVMELCREIAESLKLSKEDVELAMYCGLLHDIGRFEQWRRYETFDDAKSTDHAKLGVSILEKDNYLDKYLTDTSLKEILLKSIYYHNKYEVPEELSERDKLFCNIIRDADKVDILYLCMIDHIKINTENEAFSKKIYDDLLNEKTINRKDRKTKGDLLSVTLGLVYDINFPKSLKIIKEKDYLNQIIDLHENKNTNIEMHKQLETIREKIKEHIERRTLC